jgi:hypothetical protein
MTPIVTMLRGNTLPGALSYSLWVDSETSRILRIEFGSRVYRQDAGGTTESYQRQTISIKTDELLDASAVPPDLFTFSVPASRQVVQAMPVFTMPSPPEDIRSEQSTWEAYRSPDGDFMAVIPGGETADTERGGWHLHTSVMANIPVTFTVAYRDLDASVAPEAENAKLEAELASLVSGMQGTILSSAPATLQGHAGKEVIIRDSGNMYTRLRLFLVEGRLYAIYASALDKGILTFTSPVSGSYYTRYDVGVGTFLSSLTLLGR